MNKFAIFTACIGGYDNILQPKAVDERFDYFLFTNDVKEEKIGVWQVRRVDYTNPDMIRIARWVKTHPETLLPDYDATLWMDANIQIVSQYIYERFVELYESGAEVASIQHPERDCIYDEGFAVTYLAKYEYDTISLNWCHKLWKEHYPLHNGLSETGILFRKNEASVQVLDDMWWNSIHDYSKRDQLSFNYCVWMQGLTVLYFLPQGEHALASSHVKYIGHSKESVSIKHLKISFFERIRFKSVNLSPYTYSRAQEKWRLIYRQHFPIVWLYMLGILWSIILFPFIAKKVIKNRLR